MNKEERFWVLLAEDSTLHAEPLREFFEFKGLKCEYVYTHEDALKCVQENITNPPLIMVLDVRLPALREGIAVANNVWTMQHEYQINPTFALFISVFDEDHYKIELEALSQRFRLIFPNYPKRWQFIQKPIAFVQLDAIVSDLMHGGQKED